MNRRYEQVIGVISPQLRQSLERVADSFQEAVQEIRLRAEQPLILVINQHHYLLDDKGNLMMQRNGKELLCSYECLQQTFRGICGYSIHTHQREIVRGYVTLKGGHRAGFGATAVEQNGVVTSLKEVSSINIRVARQVFGAADSLVSRAKQGGLLLVGRPGSGKTTLLRDLARQLSGDGCSPGEKVVILDERGELAAVWDGIPQNDIGINTDVLNGFSKATAMEMAVRCLSPDVVICDEIGSCGEAETMMGCLHAGVRVVASVHANHLAELAKKPWIMMLLQAGVFDFIAVIDRANGKGKIERICETHDWMDEINRDRDRSGCPDIQRYLGGMPL